MTALLEAIDTAANEVADLTITYGRIWQGLGDLGFAADSNYWLNQWRELRQTEIHLEGLLESLKQDEALQ